MLQSFIGHGTQRAQWMILRYWLLRANVAEDIQLLLVFSSHAFFLSECVVETREFLDTTSGW